MIVNENEYNNLVFKEKWFEKLAQELYYKEITFEEFSQIISRENGKIFRWWA